MASAAARLLSSPLAAPATAWAPPRARTLAAGAGALGLGSLLLPTTPTYDPWAWLIWGREIAHGTLDTRFGPSWKPLPVLFTTLLAPLGSAAPSLWVGIARAGGLLALAMCVRVAWRLAGPGAGLAAAAALLAVSGFFRFTALGDSEGLLVALMLVGVDRHLDGADGQAAGAWLLACLLRPEIWPLAGLVAALLWRREPALRRRIAAGATACVALWTLPELWGSGDALRSAGRARNPNPNSLAFAHHPALASLSQASRLVVLPILVGLAVVLAGPARRAKGRATLVLALAALALTAAVAVMTQIGYSGNVRYLLAPAALACVAGAVGLARLAEVLLARVGASRLAGVATIGAVAAFAAGGLSGLPAQARTVGREASLLRGLTAAVHRAGGPAAVRRCGPPVTGPFQVTGLAWRLDARIDRVGVTPRVPGVVFTAGPGASPRSGAPHLRVGDPRLRPIARVGAWEVLAACRSRP